MAPLPIQRAEWESWQRTGFGADPLSDAWD